MEYTVLTAVGVARGAKRDGRVENLRKHNVEASGKCLVQRGLTRRGDVCLVVTVNPLVGDFWENLLFLRVINLFMYRGYGIYDGLDAKLRFPFGCAVAVEQVGI